MATPRSALSRTRTPNPGDPLRIAFLIYRGNPHCGGQGVYSRHLTRELTELGHSVTMLAGTAVARGRRAGGTRTHPEPRPVQAREPVPCPVAARVPHPVGRRGVRNHGRRRLPRALRVQPARVRAPARPARRVRPRPRQPVPRTRTARLRPRRLAVREHVAPPHHRRPRPRPRRRELTAAQADTAPLVRVPRHADERGAPAATSHHRVAELEEGHRRPDARRSRHLAHRCRSASTKSSSARCRTSSASRVGS